MLPRHNTNETLVSCPLSSRSGSRRLEGLLLTPSAAVQKLFELRDAIGLGPYPDAARCFQCLVANRERGDVAVEAHDELRALEIHSQGMPRTRRDRGAHTVRARAGADRLQVAPLAVDHLVRPDVVLQGVRAGDVVVLGVLPAPHHAAGLVFSSFHRAKADLDEAVLDRRAAHRPAKVRAAAVHHLTFGNIPARGALPGASGLPAILH